MDTRKTSWILFATLVVLAWALWSPVLLGAETINYKFYTYATKGEPVPVADAERHVVNLGLRKAFCVLENGEIARSNIVALVDLGKEAGSFTQYVTVKFKDGSTITYKSEGKVGKELGDGKARS
ncbi:MAG: hypothetical protein ABSH25_20965 [Syntrophorhabdales bacterium]